MTLLLALKARIAAAPTGARVLCASTTGASHLCTFTLGRVWTGALSGESLLDKRQPRGPICQQAVIPAAPASSTPTVPAAAAGPPTRIDALWLRSARRGTCGRAFSWAAPPKPCRRWPSLGYAPERRALSARHACGICRYGFQAACVERLGVHMGQPSWEQCNAVFDRLMRAVPCRANWSPQSSAGGGTRASARA